MTSSKRSSLLLIAALSFFSISACTPPASPAPAATQPQASPSQPRPVMVQPQLPEAPMPDLRDLVARLRLGTSNAVPPLQRQQTEHEVGRADDFFVVDFSSNRVNAVKARLVWVSTSAYLYVETGLNVTTESLQRTAVEIETKIIPTIRQYSNPDWDLGGGTGSRITILHTRIPGLAGYVSSLDSYATAGYQYSNERPVVYLSVSEVSVGTPAYYGVLTHEMQHLAQTQAKQGQEAWVHEGMSELLADLAGYPMYLYENFLRTPDVQLTSFESNSKETGAHYGAAHFFFKYLAGQLGFDALPKLLKAPGDGEKGIQLFLDQSGDARDFEEFVHDWGVANAFQELSRIPTDKRHTYPTSRYRVDLTTIEVEVGTRDAEVSQYASDFVVLPPTRTGYRIAFEGQRASRLLPTKAPSGSFVWWSNRGDLIDSSLTRTFDLTGVLSATLRFKLWFDIEKNFDFGYVLASKDGRTWDVLKGSHTGTSDPFAQAFGPAYSGSSSGWVDEAIDLTPYAGSRVTVQFKLLNDEGSNRPGMAIDDISVAEIGYADSAEQGGDWNANGFVRTDNVLPQSFFVSLVPDVDRGTVLRMDLDQNNRGSLRVPPEQRAILVISAAAMRTTEKAKYRYSVEASPP